MSFFSILFVTYEFLDWQGAYAPFGQNLMMSVLFLWMFFSRDDLRGQSVYIALFKMVGTGVSSLGIFPISAYLTGFLSDALSLYRHLHMRCRLFFTSVSAQRKGSKREFTTKYQNQVTIGLDY